MASATTPAGRPLTGRPPSKLLRSAIPNHITASSDILRATPPTRRLSTPSSSISDKKPVGRPLLPPFPQWIPIPATRHRWPPLTMPEFTAVPFRSPAFAPCWSRSGRSPRLTGHPSPRPFRSRALPLPLPMPELCRSISSSLPICRKHRQARLRPPRGSSALAATTFSCAAVPREALPVPSLKSPCAVTATTPSPSKSSSPATPLVPAPSPAPSSTSVIFLFGKNVDGSLLDQQAALPTTPAALPWLHVTAFNAMCRLLLPLACYRAEALRLRPPTCAVPVASLCPCRAT